MMHAYTVEITERNVVFVPAARTAADAQAAKLKHGSQTRKR